MRGARVATWAGSVLALLGLVTLSHAAEITDSDRLWQNFTREAAVVQSGQVRLEVRGLAANDDQDHDDPQVILRGFPAGDKDLNEMRADVRTVSGGVLDLFATYGVFRNTEVGLDLKAISEGLRFDDKAKENNAGLGDMTVYGKHKYQVDEQLTVAAGVECSLPTGSESKRLGTGELGTSPFVSARYKVSDRIVLGGHVGYQINSDKLDNVFNWSTQVILRGGATYNLRTEVTARHFDYAGTRLDDVVVAPGIDYRYSKNLTIRPEGLAGITRESLDWGVGVGLAYTF